MRGNDQNDGRPPPHYRRQTCGDMRKFSLPWQQGSIRASFSDTINLADPENFRLGKRVWHLSPTEIELYYSQKAQFSGQKSQIFVTSATGSVGANLNDTSKLAGPENPQFGATIWDIQRININVWHYFCNGK